MSDRTTGLFSEIAEVLIGETIFWTSEHNPFVGHLQPGDPRLAVVVGDNASGKSFFVDTMRVLGSEIHDDLSTVSISIRERTGAGQSDMSGIRRVMMFGDESEESTGAVSAKVIRSGFYNVQRRLAEGSKVLLVLDEPEMGLAETFHRAVGQLIAKEVKQIETDKQIETENRLSVAVVTHSRKLIDGLIKELGQQPTAMVLGSHASLADWVSDTQDKTVEQLIELPELGKENFRKVSNVFTTIKNKKRESNGPSA